MFISAPGGTTAYIELVNTSITSTSITLYWVYATSDSADGTEMAATVEITGQGPIEK
jgi:hypothetical protein